MSLHNESAGAVKGPHLHKTKGCHALQSAPPDSSILPASPKEACQTHSAISAPVASCGAICWPFRVHFIFGALLKPHLVHKVAPEKRHQCLASPLQLCPQLLGSIHLQAPWGAPCRCSCTRRLCEIGVTLLLPVQGAALGQSALWGEACSSIPQASLLQPCQVHLAFPLPQHH